MMSFSKLALGAVVTSLGLMGCAQTPIDKTAPQPGLATTAGSTDLMTRMDRHMIAMREMHEKMARAKSPEERNALMAEHMKLMQDGMTMMRGMGPGEMGATMGMGGMQGATSADMAARQQAMEKRMEMMQSMMQMMMDRLPPASAKP